MTSLEALARQLGFEIIAERAIKPERQTYEIRQSGETFALKIFRADRDSAPYAVFVHQHLLGRIPSRVGRLRIPRVLDVRFVEDLGHVVRLEWIDGRDFFDRWHTTKEPHVGGARLGLEYVGLAIDMIQDLTRIRVDKLVPSGLAVMNGREITTFWNRHLHLAREDGWLGADDAARARTHAEWLAQDVSGQPLTISNMDFRFANFLEVDPDQTGIIDWDGARASAYEIEHCISYLWLQMWRNTEWQRGLIAGARQAVGIKEARLRAVLLKRTLGQAHTWRVNPTLQAQQIRLFRLALDNEGWRRIWCGS